MLQHPLFSFRAFIIYLNATAQALLFALMIPTLSLYVAERFQVSAFWVGTFFVGLASFGIIYAQVLGNLSDKLRDRRRLIALGMAGGGIACLGFSSAESYWFALLLGLLFFSLAFASISQTFAHARDFADTHLNRKQSVMFNSTVRAFSALAWVGGPPLGFYVLSQVGFKWHYIAVATLYFSGALGAWLFLPAAKGFTPTEHLQLPNQKRTIMIAMVAFSLLWACNQSYLIALPLYLTSQLHVEAHWAGWIMGTAAAIEIPIMIFAGWLGTKFSLSRLVRIGAIAPIVLYLGIWQATAVWQLFPLQICNALLIGFIAGLGMTWFQDLMPGKTGAASALFWNTTNFGSIIGSLVIAVFAQWLGYRDMFIVNALMATLATLLLFTLEGKNKKQHNIRF